MFLAALAFIAAWAFSSCKKQGYSLIAVPDLSPVTSLWWSTGSRVHGFQKLWHVCPVVVVYVSALPPRMWNLPRPETEPMSSLGLAGEFFTTGKSWSSFCVQSSLWQSGLGFEVLRPPWTPSSISLSSRGVSLLYSVSWNFSLGHNLGLFCGGLSRLIIWSQRSLSGVQSADHLAWFLMVSGRKVFLVSIIPCYLEFLLSLTLHIYIPLLMWNVVCIRFYCLISGLF